MNKEIENHTLEFNLRELMKERGITGNRLARELGERPATLHDLIENRDMESRRIPARIIAKLCAYFEITPNELFTVIRIPTNKEE